MDKILEKFPNIKTNYNLAQIASFKIGGPAKYYLETKKVKELQEVIKFCKENKINLEVIGGASNLLINDNGYNGLIIKLINRNIIFKDYKFIVDAGVVLLNFVNFLLEKPFTNYEHLAGIPGTIGGAIHGNSGAYGKAIGDIIESVDILDLNNNLKTLSKKECRFEYRKSIFSEKKYIILRANIVLEKYLGDLKVPRDLVNQRIIERVHKHPLNYPNVGSWFKNIILTEEVRKKLSNLDLSKFEKYKKIPAAFLIEKAGLKAYQIGGAQMSEKHANFLINKENATAKDVIDLSNYIKKKIKEIYDLDFQEEVQYIGF